MENKFNSIILSMNRIFNEVRLDRDEMNFTSNGINYIGRNITSILVRVFEDGISTNDLSPILWMGADSERFNITLNSEILRVLNYRYHSEERLFNKIISGFKYSKDNSNELYKFDIEHIDEFINYIESITDDIVNNESFKYLLMNDL